MKQNPWAGLASYQDPAAGSTLLFCGRDNESYDLAALVDDNIFCTLYGKSGTGKTSLLNAGVFPRLREMGYLPVSIRLGMEAMGTTFQQCITARLAQVAELRTADTVALPADDQDEQWLWAWFARTRFVDGEGKVKFPVLVFDQFEEVFRGRRAEAEALLRQIHFMMDPSHSLGDDYDYNFRFLASIREDDLYLLEDSLDRCYLDEMKKCRYRLRPLNYENALSVVLKPGKEVLDASEAQVIAETVIDMARSEQDDTISTNLLSLLCSRLYAKMEHMNADRITLEMLSEFMEESPIIQFYNEATAGFRVSERNYIEDNMVDSSGRRNSVSESDFRMHVRNADRLMEGDCKILQRTSVGGGGQDYRIELIHDSFCEPLVEIKEQRGSRRMIWWMLGVFLILCGLVAALAGPISELRQIDTVKIGYYDLLHASYSAQALEQGDYDLAVRLALESLKQNERGDWDYSYVYTPMGEAALRNAMQQHPAFAHLFAVREVDMDTVETFGEFISIKDTGDAFQISNNYYFNFLKNDTVAGTWIWTIEVDTALRIYGIDQWGKDKSGETVYGKRVIATYDLHDFRPIEYLVLNTDNYIVNPDGNFVRCALFRVIMRAEGGKTLELLYPEIHYLMSHAKAYYVDKKWTEMDTIIYNLGPENPNFGGLIREYELAYYY